LWVIIALAGLFTLVVLVLSIPLDLAFRLDVHGRPKFSLRLVWLFGLVSKDLKRGKKKPSKRKPRKRRGGRGIFRILRTKGLLRQLKALVMDILGCLKIRDLSIDFRVGLDNPADTGLLFATIGPSLIFLSPSVRRSISIKPSFEVEAVLEGYAQAAVRLRPIRLLVPLLRFVFSLAFLRVIKTVVLAKWKRKK
jgi:hypothetical protein